MLSSHEASFNSRFLGYVAGAALAVAVSAGLAGCGGGGGSAPGGGGEVKIMPDPSQGSPDLVVESSSVSDAAPEAGAGFTLSARVRNAGKGSAAATTVRFYRSDDAVITPSDLQVDAKTLGELAAERSVDESADLTAPSDPGVYYYGACADVVDGESDTANNCSTGKRVEVRESPPPAGGLVNALPRLARPAAGPPPDLVVESPSVSNPNPVGLEYFTFSASVRNAGDGPSPAATVRFYRLYSRFGGLRSSMGSVRVSELAASGSVSVSMQILAPQMQRAYWYAACVGPVAGGSDAEYGCSSLVRITVPQEYPDLVVESPSASDARPFTGVDFTLSATVRNAGDEAAAATTARFYRSADKTISTSDTEVGSRQAVARLAASRSASASASLTASEAHGTYYYGVCVDAVDGESDAANNCSAAVKVEVQERPDISHGTPWSANPDPAAGGVFGMYVRLRSAQAGTAGFWLRYYRSDDATFAESGTQVRTSWQRGMYSKETRRVRVVLGVPSTTGTYYYRACADAVAGESNTANNCSSALKIAASHSKPNLEFEGGSVSSRAGSRTFKMGATVRNVGGPSPTTTLRFYHSTDNRITPSDTELSNVSVPALKSTKSKLVPTFRGSSISITPPSSGAHHYGACVDTVTDESDTTDNCLGIHSVE